MPSDPKRVDQVFEHLRRIRAGNYPQIEEVPADRGGGYRIMERPWEDVPEPNKLAILQGAVDWSGVTNRDRAHILLGEIDPGKITDTQRDRLIEMALGPELKQAARGKDIDRDR